MSTPNERTRALVWAGGLLVQISRDHSLPVALRRQATVIARHFPPVEEISSRCLGAESSLMGLERPSPAEFEEWVSQLEHGPLAARTRLSWPD